jgi:hypothetical protein
VGEDAADEALGRHVTCSIAEFDGQKAEGITLRSSNEKQRGRYRCRAAADRTRTGCGDRLRPDMRR